jgi:rhamnulokinase
MNQKYPEILKECTTLFMIPDYFYFLLTGKKISEYTDASTTQLLDANKRVYSEYMLKKLNLKSKQFPPVTMPGVTIGPLQKEVQELTKLNAIPVHVVASHDTGSAVAAIPHIDASKTWAYISSGTWSLLGIESPEPIISDQVRKYNLTNEGGVDGTIRFLKNIMGLWLIQRCKTEWDAEGNILEHPKIQQLARESPAFQSIVYPDDNRFFNPKSMIKEIQGFCKETKQKIPTTVGEIARCVYESLACRYREVLEQIEELNGKKIQQLHIVGGGSQNQVLDQITADMTQKEVITGPVECTAIGNILMQARATGLIKNLKEMREIVTKSFPIKVFTPGAPCEEGYKKYLSFLKK